LQRGPYPAVSIEKFSKEPAFGPFKVFLLNEYEKMWACKLCHGLALQPPRLEIPLEKKRHCPRGAGGVSLKSVPAT